MSQGLLDFFARGHVLLDGDKVMNFSILAADRRDGHLLVIPTAVLAFIHQFAMPDLAGADGRPHFGEKFPGMPA